MRRRWKILISIVAGLVVLLILNAIVLDHQTKGAKITEPGAQIVSVLGGDLQVKQDGPRDAPPIVILHCFTCSINWWDRITPLLARHHRVIRIDLLGHGGSEKPSGGYSMENQARLVALVLGKLDVRGATVVGHSMGANVAVALAQESRQLVKRLVIVDQSPNTDLENHDLLLSLSLKPVIGEAMKRTAPDFMVKDGLGQAFAPGFDVPDQFVDDLKGMTYTAYRNSANADGDFRDARPLDERVASERVPLLAIFGSKDQIEDVDGSLKAYRDGVPGAETHVVAGAGHSPQVERPQQTAKLILGFADQGATASGRRPSPTRPCGRAGRSRRGRGARRGGGRAGCGRRPAARHSASR
jgi:pimeloyl-ACP methyl ester carboxylesterase